MWMPHGEGDGHWPMTPQFFFKDATFKPGRDFGKVFSHWKVLKEHMTMVTSLEEFMEL
jgi:hypothetical protein